MSVDAISASSGGIDRTEMAKKMFKKLDANSDNKLDETELVALQKDGKGPSASEILTKFDANSDGSIDLDEHTKAMESGPKGPPPPPKETSSADGKSQLFEEILKQLKGETSTTSSTASDSDTEDVFAALDTDKSGAIDKSEVQAMLDRIKQQTSLGSLYSSDGNSGTASSSISSFIDTFA